MEGTGQWNQRLAMLKAQQREIGDRQSPKSPPTNKNGLGALAAKPLIERGVTHRTGHMGNTPGPFSWGLRLLSPMS